MNENNKYQQALQAISQNKPDEAIELLKEILKENNGPNSHLHWQLSQMYTTKSNLSEALHHIEKAINLEPQNASFLSERAVIYFHLNKYSLALIDLNHAAELEPQNPYRYSSRAFLKERLGDDSGAISDYELAVKLDPEDSVAHNNLGLLYEKAGWKEKAGDSFSKADEKKEAEKFVQMFATNSTPPVHENNNAQEPENSFVDAKNQTYFSVIRKVFSDSETRLEFIRFILGKKNDK